MNLTKPKTNEIFFFFKLASVGTTASLVSIKNNLKSNMAGFAARDSEAFDNNQQSFIASEGCSSRMRFSDVVFNYQRRRVSGPDSLNYFYTSEVNSNEKNNLTPIKNKRYFKQPNMTRQAKRYAQAIRKEDRYDNEFQMIKASTSNSNFRGPEAFSDYQTSVIKSSSVPNFQVIRSLVPRPRFKLEKFKTGLISN